MSIQVPLSGLYNDHIDGQFIIFSPINKVTQRKLPHSLAYIRIRINGIAKALKRYSGDNTLNLCVVIKMINSHGFLFLSMTVEKYYRKLGKNKAEGSVASPLPSFEKCTPNSHMDVIKLNLISRRFDCKCASLKVNASQLIL